MNAVFFDMDGTLIDSRADLGATVNFTRAALGLAPIPLEEAISYVGNGARFLLEHAIPEWAGRFDEIWPMYVEQYRAHMLDRTTLYPGVRATLAELHDRGWLMGINTNKPNFACRAILEHFGLARYFGNAVVAGGDCPEMKPGSTIQQAPSPFQRTTQFAAKGPTGMIFLSIRFPPPSSSAAVRRAG